MLEIPEHMLEKLEYLAYHDSLTGLYNRNWLYENLSELNSYEYVYFIDIDDLKSVNDSQGHIAGDKYIQECIEEIKNKYVKSGEKLIRYAGDEFILFSNLGYNWGENALLNEDKYTVGFATNDGDVMRTIGKADQDLIRKKS